MARLGIAWKVILRVYCGVFLGLLKTFEKILPALRVRVQIS